MNTFLRNNIVASLILLFIGFVVISAIMWKISPPITNYLEEKISFNDLEYICKSDAYIDKAKQKVFNSQNYLPRPGIKLKLNFNVPQVYKAFRWRCEYKFNAKEPGAVELDDIKIALDLDKYCQNKSNTTLTKSTYRHYNDEYSWYCVNPNF